MPCMRLRNPSPAQQAILVALGLGSATMAVWALLRKPKVVATTLTAAADEQPDEDASSDEDPFAPGGDIDAEPSGEQPSGEQPSGEQPSGEQPSGEQPSWGGVVTGGLGMGGKVPKPKPKVTTKSVGGVTTTTAPVKALVTLVATGKTGTAAKYSRVAKVAPVEVAPGKTLAGVASLSNTDVGDPHTNPSLVEAKVSNLKLRNTGTDTLASFKVAWKWLTDSGIKTSSTTVTDAKIAKIASLDANGVPTAVTALANSPDDADGLYRYAVAVGLRDWTSSASKVDRTAAAAAAPTTTTQQSSTDAFVTKRLMVVGRRYGKESSKRPEARSVRVIDVKPNETVAFPMAGLDGAQGLDGSWSSNEVTITYLPATLAFPDHRLRVSARPKAGVPDKQAIDPVVPLPEVISGIPALPLTADPPKAGDSGKLSSTANRFTWTKVPGGTTTGDLTLFFASVPKSTPLV